MNPVRIVIADDHRLVLEALARILHADDGFDVAGTTHAGADVVGLVASEKPEMVLMDIHMPDLDGLTILDLLREKHPDVKVVLISAGADAGEIRSALRRGASGYLVKSINPNDVPAALRQIHEGTAYSLMDLETSDGNGGKDPGVELARKAGLTPRELEIFKAITRGLSNREIAQEMWVTEQTVKFHLSNVYRKLDVPNRAAALRMGVLEGLDATNLPATSAAA